MRRIGLAVVLAIGLTLAPLARPVFTLTVIREGERQ